LRTLRAQAEERRSSARRDGDAVIAQARSQAQTEAATIAADYAAEAAKLVDDAHATVARELAQAREQEQHIVESLADTLLTRALGSGVAA